MDTVKSDNVQGFYSVSHSAFGDDLAGARSVYKGDFFSSLVCYLYFSVHINYARALPLVLFSTVLPLWGSLDFFLYHNSRVVISLNYMAGDRGRALENTFALEWFSHCSCCKTDEVIRWALLLILMSLQ